MHKGENFDCAVLSVMTKHFKSLNIFSLKSNLFGPEQFMFSWVFLDSDN